jgi:hypothetical protein
VKNKHDLGIWIGLTLLGCGAPLVSFANCQYSNAAAQQQCLAMEAQQRAQQAQQQAQMRAQQEAQQRAQQEAQQRAQQEAQQRAQQEAQQRAQQEAQQRAQQEAQQRAQQEAQQRSQQQAQQRAQQQAQQRAQQQAQERAQQQAQQRSQQEAQQRSQQQAQQRVQQQASSVPRQQPHEANTPTPAQRPSISPGTSVRETGVARAPAAAQSSGAAVVHTSPPFQGVAAKSAAPAAAPKAIQLNASTKAIVRPGSSVMTVKRTGSNGTQVVVNRQVAHGKSLVTNAYISKREANGDRSRTYLDGHKIVYAKSGNIVRTSPNRISVTTQRTGLRQASLADGRPVYRERVEHSVISGKTREVVVRTDYARVVIGRPVFYSAPVIRRYDVVNYYGYPVLAYEPVVFAAPFFGPFLVGFPQPVFVTPACVFCPAPVVVWQQPVQSYSDPVDLVADLQITSAVQDGMAEAPPPAALDSSFSQEDPQVAELKEQVSAIQQQVDAESESNADLRSQVAQLQKNAAATPAVAFSVPEPVRQQIHKQVRDNIRLHQEKRALTWPDVVASGDAPNYIFQVSDMLDATDNNGEECPLTTGDLLKLETGTAPDKEVLTMHVVTSKLGSCMAGAVISVSIHDAQAMLNDFNQRQEANMQKLQPQIALANKS